MFDAFYTECEDRIAREPYEDSAPTNGGACNQHAGLGVLVCRVWALLTCCRACQGLRTTRAGHTSTVSARLHPQGAGTS